MVKYYGRARQRVGSVNTNQLGLKMSGCPGKVGLNPVNNRYIQHRVNCMNGVCGFPLQNGAPWRVSPFRNLNTKYCKPASNKCLAAAGGICTIYTPYFKTNRAGTKGCGFKTSIPRGSGLFGVADAVIGNPPCNTTNFKTTKVAQGAAYNVCSDPAGTAAFPVFGEITGVNTAAPALTATYPNVKAIFMGNNVICPDGTVIIYVNSVFPQGTPIAANFTNTLTGQVSVYLFVPGGGPPGSAYYKLQPLTPTDKLDVENAYCVQLLF